MRQRGHGQALARAVATGVVLAIASIAIVGCDDPDAATGVTAEYVALVISAPAAPPVGPRTSAQNSIFQGTRYRERIRIQLVPGGVSDGLGLGIDGVDVQFALTTVDYNGDVIGTLVNADQTTANGGIAQLPQNSWTTALHDEFVEDPADVQDFEIQTIVVLIDGEEVPTRKWFATDEDRPIELETRLVN